jgi:DNA adenine methylase
MTSIVVERGKQIVHGVAHPFVKWAGGKTQLLDAIDSMVPDSFGRYFEPFLGGGAVFFHLVGKGVKFESRISDINSELINAYITIKSNVEELIEVLQIYEQEYRRDPAVFYYQLRDSPEYSNNDNVKRSARFITLNRTCFNGLYRVNRQGKFNVPMGRYNNPTICNSDNLRNVSAALNQSNARISVGDYKDILLQAKENDFIYLDPPYVPSSKTSDFTGYTNNGFTVKDQEDLSNTFKKLDSLGCRVLLSNSDTPLVRELYCDYASNIVEVDAKRAINSKANRRTGHKELLIRNYQLH